MVEVRASEQKGRDAVRRTHGERAPALDRQPSTFDLRAGQTMRMPAMRAMRARRAFAVLAD
jgi:hypothetical protein